MERLYEDMLQDNTGKPICRRLLRCHCSTRKPTQTLEELQKSSQNSSASPSVMSISPVNYSNPKTSSIACRSTKFELRGLDPLMRWLTLI